MVKLRSFVCHLVRLGIAPSSLHFWVGHRISPCVLPWRSTDQPRQMPLKERSGRKCSPKASRQRIAVGHELVRCGSLARQYFSAKKRHWRVPGSSRVPRYFLSFFLGFHPSTAGTKNVILGRVDPSARLVRTLIPLIMCIESVYIHCEGS